jgi:NADPH:quinone reductase
MNTVSTSTMRAIQVAHTGEPDVLSIAEVPTPAPGPGEALVKIHAAGINYVDIYMRKGIYDRPTPFIPGLEASGVVEAIGEDVSQVEIGDRVAYSSTIGSYAEYNVVKASHLIPLPSDIDFVHGAAFPLQGMTAQYLLHEFHIVKPGDFVLVHAAAGGVGLLLVQWLRHLGAKAIGTVSDDTKAMTALDAGAEHVIVYTREDFVDAVRRITNGAGADYIIDGVGKSTFDQDLEAVKARGHIVVFGSASGAADPISPNSLMPKCITLSGGMLFEYVADRAELLTRSSEVIRGIQKGWLKLHIDRVLPLEQASEAHRLLESRQTRGKLILKIAD